MELYCELDLRNYHQEIAECLMSAAFEAVENLVEVCGENVFEALTVLVPPNKIQFSHESFTSRLNENGME